MRRNAGKVELQQGSCCQKPSHARLEYGISTQSGYQPQGVKPCAGGWDGGVAVDDLGQQRRRGSQHPGQWSYVQQQDAGNVAGKNATLNSCTVCNNLVWVNGHVRLLVRSMLLTRS